MPPTPSQIRELLVNSIDQDSNVVDMGNVKQAIAFLEKTLITKEALEATRLGKTINDIRKKTTDRELAARCKSLVRQWQKQFVRSAKKKDPAASTTGTTSTPSTATTIETDRTSTSNSQGDVAAKGGPPSRGTQAATTSSVDKTRKENRKRRKTATSASSSPSSGPTHPAKRIGQVSSVSVDSTDSSINGLPNQVTPKSNKVSSKKRTKLQRGGLKSAAPKGSGDKAKAGKAEESALSTPSQTLSPSGEHKVSSIRNSSPADSTIRTTQNQKHSPNVSIPKVSKVSKTSAASPSSTSTPPQLSTKVVKSISSLKVGAKSPRNSTKNTLFGSSSPSMKLTGSSSPTVRRNLCGIEDGNSSAATVKLRTSKQNLVRSISPSLDCKSLPSSSINFQTYASTSEIAVNVENAEQTESSKTTLKSMKSIFDDDSSDEDEFVETKIADPTNPLNTFSLASPTRNTPEIQDSDEETNVIAESSVVNKNGKNFVPKTTPINSEFPSSTCPETLEDDEEEVVVKKPVSQEDVKRLHDDKWEGVNGCYDDKGEWFDWTQCLSVLFNEEEQPLHILPYVSIN